MQIDIGIVHILESSCILRLLLFSAKVWVEFLSLEESFNLYSVLLNHNIIVALDLYYCSSCFFILPNLNVATYDIMVSISLALWKLYCIVISYFLCFVCDIECPEVACYYWSINIIIGDVNTFKYCAGLLVFDNSQNIRSQREVLDSEVSPRKITRTKEKHIVPDFCIENRPVHSYIFGSDYVSLDAFGKVLILSVPLLPLKDGSHSKCTIASSTKSLNSLKQDSCY